MATIDLEQLQAELAAAGLDPNVCLVGDEVFAVDAGGSLSPPSPEQQAVIDAHDGTVKQRTAAFEAQEDAERLARVTERAAEDPAFAALAELTLGKQGVQT